MPLAKCCISQGCRIGVVLICIGDRAKFTLALMPAFSGKGKLPYTTGTVLSGSVAVINAMCGGLCMCVPLQAGTIRCPDMV